MNAEQALRWRQYMLQQFGVRWRGEVQDEPGGEEAGDCDGCGGICSGESGDALQLSWSVKEL